MKTIYKLIDIMHTNNIAFSFENLPKDRLGYYQHSSSGFFIILDNSLNENPTLKKCVLAEELGHYFTTIGLNEPSNNHTYRKKISIDKEEEKAMKWAVDYLIDTDYLIEYLSNNLRDGFNDLVEYFSVTNKFMIKKLELMALKNTYWHIINNNYLCLTSLPNVYIVSTFDENFTSKLDEICQ